MRLLISPDFRAGLLAIFPVLVAAVPIGVLWGALAAKAGLSPLEAVLMSASVFAGAAQFMAIGEWQMPVPVLSIVLATFLINLRHVIMGASLSRRMDCFSTTQKWLAFFPMADENWALAEARARAGGVTPPHSFGLSLPFVPVWTMATGIGASFGAMLGDPASFGFDFIFSVIFLALIVGFRRVPGWLFAVIASAVAATIAFRFLPTPWYVLAGAAAGMLAAAYAPRHEGRR
jgi:4-azaleucine resistance transporter AzlC